MSNGEHGMRAFADKRSDLFHVTEDKVFFTIDDTSPLFDPRIKDPVDPRKVANVVEVGILKPLFVKKVVVDGAMRLEIEDGRTRYRWLRAANAIRKEKGLEPHLCPVLVSSSPTTEDSQMRMIAGNIHEEEGVVSKATKAKRLLASGKPRKEVALLFAVSEQTIRNWELLLSASPPVVRAVSDGKLGMVLALQLAALPPEEQEKNLPDMLGKKGQDALEDARETKAKAKGKKGKAKDDDSDEGEGKKKKKPKMVRAQAAIAFVKRLGDLTTRDAKLATAVLKWCMGSPRALAEFQTIYDRSKEDE